MADDNSSSTDTANSRWKKSKIAAGLRAAGSSLTSSGQDEMDRASSERITPVAYHRGGKIRKTGLMRLEKGERVIAKGKTKRIEKMMRKAKMRMKARA